jgi:hypothetical protein
MDPIAIESVFQNTKTAYKADPDTDGHIKRGESTGPKGKKARDYLTPFYKELEKAKGELGKKIRKGASPKK